MLGTEVVARGHRRLGRSDGCARHPRTTPPAPHATPSVTSRRCSHLRPLLVTSDFDGTLSVPQMDPWGATVLPRRAAGAADACRTRRCPRGAAVRADRHRPVEPGARRARPTTSATRAWSEGDCAGASVPRSLVVVPHPAPERAWAMARLLEREVPRQVPDRVAGRGAQGSRGDVPLPRGAGSGRRPPSRSLTAVDRLDPERRAGPVPGQTIARASAAAARPPRARRSEACWTTCGPRSRS